ncbi:MAG: TerB family tellurite resistance protein [Campylobacterota bacterium]|nr:TerB family tellurite resistance protein [Campylobacterota bacterium]
MEQKIKKSVATILAHIIKVDKRDVAKETPLFCRLMDQDFGCDSGEAEQFLQAIMQEDYDIEEHAKFIRKVLKDDQYTKYKILKQLNQVICSDEISDEDYKEFERIREILFPNTIEN